MFIRSGTCCSFLARRVGHSQRDVFSFAARCAIHSQRDVLSIRSETGCSYAARLLLIRSEASVYSQQDAMFTCCCLQDRSCSFVIVLIFLSAQLPTHRFSSPLAAQSGWRVKAFVQKGGKTRKEYDISQSLSAAHENVGNHCNR